MATHNNTREGTEDHPFQDDEARGMAVTAVRKMINDQVFGNNKVTVDTAKNRYFVVHNQGKGEDVIRTLIRDVHLPVEQYGGERDNIRLVGFKEARDFVEEYGESDTEFFKKPPWL
jgi:hypothetical protein